MSERGIAVLVKNPNACRGGPSSANIHKQEGRKESKKEPFYGKK